MKLYELFNEGKVKNDAIDRAFDTSNKKARFAIMINGKLWLKNGTPVHFNDYASALKSANSITAKKNITTQVVQM